MNGTGKLHKANLRSLKSESIFDCLFIVYDELSAKNIYLGIYIYLLFDILEYLLSYPSARGSLDILISKAGVCEISYQVEFLIKCNCNIISYSANTCTYCFCLHCLQ